MLVSCVGFTAPNATAGALERHAEYAGSASALFGTLTYSCGTVAALTVSAVANGTALPMAAGAAACSVAAFVLYGWLVERQPEATAAAATPDAASSPG